VQKIPVLPSGHRIVCGRCGTAIQTRKVSTALARTLAFALTAAVLYPPAIFLPVLTIEKFGQRHSASVWDGALDLLSEGDLLIGGAILVCSIVVPLLKIAGLIALTVPGIIGGHHRASTYRLIELTGRWSMLDVLLVALLVAALKLRDLVQVVPGTGAVAFTLCVVFSILASTSFDPHALWEENE
jgi:paraquat-inducible protein A